MTAIGILIGAATAVSAAGTIYSGQQASKAAKAQRNANRLQQQQNAIEQQRARKNAIREARIARGQALNQGANAGVSDSSGVQGALGSITSQANTNLSFLDEASRIADQASTQLGIAQKYTVKAQTGASAAQLGGQVANFAGTPTGSSIINRVFGGSS